MDSFKQTNVRTKTKNEEPIGFHKSLQKCIDELKYSDREENTYVGTRSR